MYFLFFSRDTARTFSSDMRPDPTVGVPCFGETSRELFTSPFFVGFGTRPNSFGLGCLQNAEVVKTSSRTVLKVDDEEGDSARRGEARDPVH